MLYNHIFFDIYDNLKIKTVAFLTAFHIVLGMLIKISPNIAFAHVIMTILIGCYFVFNNFKFGLVILIFYISAIELSWRMAGSGYIFWEGGKYYISFLILLEVIKNIYNNKLFSFYPIVYILLMSLSTVLLDFDSYRAFKMLSFNLSGHICLGLSLIYFLNMKFSDKEQIIIYIVMITAIFSTATMGIYEILFSYEDIIFTTETNKILSGDFGGNQYGIMLGFCPFICLICLLYFQKFLNTEAVVFLIITVIIMSALSLATFSRTALYLVVISIVFPTLIKFQFSIKKLFVSSIIIVVFSVAAISIFDELSDGLFSERFSDTIGTGRYEITRADLEIFSNNIIAGVGPGGAVEPRSFIYGKRTPAHNEFSRILAEHGIIGFITFLSVYYIIFKNNILFVKHYGSHFQSIIIYMTLYLAVNGFRFALPAICFAYLTSSFYFDHSKTDV